jgi:hypothetical protein
MQTRNQVLQQQLGNPEIKIFELLAKVDAGESLSSLSCSGGGYTGL